MAFNKIRAFMLTDLGKKCAYYSAGFASTTVLLANVLPHTIFLEQYKNFLHLYKKGFAVNLSPQLTATFENALELANINPKDRHLFKPFSAFGFDIVSAGSSYSHFGVAIGLPANFAYNSREDIDKHAIKLRDDSIVWETEEGKLLQDSLVLSENAKIYAMAREVKFRESPKLFIDTISSVISITGVYGLANGFNEKLNLYVRPLGFRLVMYAIVGAFTLGSYTLVKDLSQVYYEDKIDTELRNANPVFIEGGREFYSKLLNRNIALRKLLGSEGEKAYTVLGNENTLFRYKTMPLVQRRTNFEQAAQANVQ